LATAVEFRYEHRGFSSVMLQDSVTCLADLIPAASFINSAGVFWERRLIELVGLMNVKLHYGFDKEYWMRMLAKGCVFTVDNSLVSAAYRFHASSKTVTAPHSFQLEWAQVGLQLAASAELSRSEVSQLKARLIYNATRLAQDRSLSATRRFGYLLAGLRGSPAVVLRRDWLGTLLRLLKVR
jgi:hypothetical protein